MLKLIYFTADWCRPCRKYGPVLIHEAAARGIELERVDVDQDVEGLALAYGVQSLPTVLVFWREEALTSSRWHLVERFGYLTTSALTHKLDRAR